jgi:exopolysaccharide biosynthesis protein
VKSGECHIVHASCQLRDIDFFLSPRGLTLKNGWRTRFFMICLVFHATSVYPRGSTLEELAALLLEHGARFAMNMDGGGSSTMVYEKNRVMNRPTCLDIPFPSCQRSVATVLCVSKE